MDMLRHIALAAGRALALLAVLAVVLVPALPAHARLHGWDATAIQGHAAQATDRAGDQVDAGDFAHPGGDGCLACHVTMIPAALAIPLPSSRPRGSVRAGDRKGPPDIPAERLPEPPRSFA